MPDLLIFDEICHVRVWLVSFKDCNFYSIKLDFVIFAPTIAWAFTKSLMFFLGICRSFSSKTTNFTGPYLTLFQPIFDCFANFSSNVRL